MSTSVAYLRKRLADIGRDDLLAGAEAGLFSVHAAAIEAGLIKQPDVTGNGSQNQSKRIAWAIHKATRGTASPAQPGLSHGTQPAPNMPDLAAAIAEWEEARRPTPPAPPPAEPEPEPARAPEPAVDPETFAKMLVG